MYYLLYIIVEDDKFINYFRKIVENMVTVQPGLCTTLQSPIFQEKLLQLTILK